jgi:hypothetical protein
MRTIGEKVSADRRSAQFVFVGERRGQRAIQMGVRWEHGRLCAKTLHDALHAIGLDPVRQTYLNVYTDGDPPTLDDDALTRIVALVDSGAELVAMGRIVQRVLTRAGLPYRCLIHPAARGAIRARAAYQAHVAAVLGPAVPATGSRP